VWFKGRLYYNEGEPVENLTQEMVEFYNHNEIKANILKFNFFNHPSLMYTKKLVEAIGDYNHNFKFTENYDFVMRAISYGKVHITPEHLIKYRINKDGLTQNNMISMLIHTIRAKLNAIRNYGYPKKGLFIIFNPLVYLKYYGNKLRIFSRSN